MKFRRRTIRRLGAFLVIAALLSAGAIWLHERGAQRAAQRLAGEREQGLELLALGEYEAALSALGNYLSDADPERVERDFDARLAYARARARVPHSGERHLEQSARLLRDLADDFASHPRRLEALHLLMNLTADVGEWQELGRLCDQTLNEFPDDPHALRMRRESAEQAGNYAAALADAQRLCALSPGDVEEQIASMRLLARLGQTPEAIRNYAVDLVARDPGDPRLLLVLAAAYRHAGQDQQALTCLTQAAQSELPEQETLQYIIRLAGLFDTFGEPARARQFYADALSRLPPQNPARDRLRQLLALRLWQGGQLQDALELIGPLSVEERRRSLQLAVLHTLLLFESGDTAQAEQSLALLSRTAQSTEDTTDRRVALAWCEALTSTYMPGSMTSRQRLELLADAYARLEHRQWPAALPRDEPTGLLLSWAGDRYFDVGEIEEAIAKWTQAASALPGWAEPLIKVAEASLLAGLLDEAETAAQRAGGRAETGGDQRARELLVRVAYARWLAAPSTTGAQEAAALAAEHQRAYPLDAATLPIHVHMLSLTDAVQARRLIRQRVERGADGPLRVDLARVSRMAELGLEQELLDGIPHPEAALILAQARAAAGEPEQALEMFDEAHRRAAAEPDVDETAVNPAAEPVREVEWHLARARLLETVRPAEAAATWRQIAEGYPQDAKTQLAVLEQATVARTDAQLTARTVERLAELTGPSGRRWRMEKARALLSRGEAGAALEAAETLRSLIRQSGGSDSIDERVLLSEALTLTGSLPVATEHLEAAYALDRTRGDVGLRLIGLYERIGRREEARRLLGQMAAEGVQGRRERLEVAHRLAEGGSLETAISLLQQSDAAGQLESLGQVLLAELLHRAGRTGEAERTYSTLLGAQAGPRELLSAAVFLGRTGRPEQAREVLARLEDSDLTQAERELVTAAYLARVGEVQAARQALTRVIEQHSTATAAVREAVVLEIGAHQYETAQALLDQARRDGVADERLDRLAVQVRALLQAGDGDATLEEHLASLAGALPPASPELGWEGLSDALEQVARDLRGGRPLAAGELAQLERAARVFEYHAPLHQVLARGHLTRGRPEEAARVASRLAESLPHDWQAQRLAFETARDAGRFAEAEHYAHRWKQVGADDPLSPDVGIAEARLLAADYRGAAELLEPYLERAAAAPSEHWHVLSLAAEAHAAMEDYRLAFQFVSPHLGQGAQWRSVALHLAAERVGDVAEAHRWLNAVETALGDVGENPSDSPAVSGAGAELFELAAAWARVGERFSDPQARERGRALLEQLTAHELRQSPDAWEALARVAAAGGELEKAEASYRRVLTLDPRRTSAANELARLLLGSDDPTVRSEVLTWARIATEQSPSNPRYHETLARAHLAVRDTASARAEFERALRLDERDLASMLGLTTLLLEAGERDSAARWFERLQPLYREAPTQPPNLQREFDQLAARLEPAQR